MSFVPIHLGDYVGPFLKHNRGENGAEVTARLRTALEAYKTGAGCLCGEPIWVAGSAEAGHACFPRIIGEAEPSDDYEITGDCDKQARRPSRIQRQKRPPHPCGARAMGPS